MSIVRTMGRTFVGAAALVGLVGLASCGGGGGSGQTFPGISPSGTTAVDSSNQSFQSDAFLIGAVTNGAVTYGAYPTNPVNPSLGPNGIPLPVIPNAQPFTWGSANFTVPSPVFVSPPIGAQSFIEIEFGSPLKASTIKSAQPSIVDGIALFYMTGPSLPCQVNGTVCTALDFGGVVNPGNAVANDVAPSRLRLYYDSDGVLPAGGAGNGAEAFPPGQYVLRINSTLRFSDGRPFNNGLTSNGVATGANAPVMPSWGFAIGADTFALDTTGPSEGIRVNNVTANGASSVPLNSEIIINFNDAVDFSTLVGANNLTSRDPFITQPFQLAQFGPDLLPGTADDGGPLTIGNLTITYLLPIDPTTGLPAQVPYDLLGTTPPCGPNLGVVVYQPDPKTNPNQVRIRFVNIATLIGAENVAGGAFQNYASNPDKYPIRSTNQTLVNPATGLTPLLTLPPIQPVPGSIATTPATAVAACNVTYAAAVTDRAGNPANAQTAQFTWALGPPPARNPMGADLLLIGMQSGGPNGLPGIGAVNMATGTANAGPGGALTGAGTLRPNALQNLAFMGVPLDFEVDLACNPFWAAGVAWDAPRGTTIPGIPDTPNQLITNSIFGTATPQNPVPAPHGTLIWAIDGTSKTLKLFNSFDWTLISTIAGVPSPGGLGMTPNFTSLFVSNTEQGTLQRVELNPGSPAYGTVTNTISVGPGPRSVAVTPSNEDVFCLNYGGNSVSIVRIIGVTERLRFSGGLGPADVCITNRMLGQGLTNEYQAFITNQFSNTVDVFESAGGAEFFNLPDGRVVGSGTGLLSPTRCAWNYQTYIGAPLEPGALIVNSAGTTITEFTMASFAVSPPPGFAGIPYKREFRVLRNFSGGSLAPGATPTDATMDAMAGASAPPAVPNTKAGVPPTPRMLLIAYPSAGAVVAYDYLGSGAAIASIAVPGCDILHNFWSQ